ncbi:MAG: CRTAC1 family protein, partial [Verrucomicrobia bacterium]|nr:CRTAC1 family protein [Verrucomicrobiota bacterium]
YGANWADYDNDGHLDLIIVRSSQSSQSSLFFRNQGDGTFLDITSSSLPNEPDEAAAWGDYDNDGFLDLFLTTSQRNHLYRNNGSSNHWIKVKLVGSVSNRSAIGAKVRVKATIAGKTFWQMREISTSGGFGKADMRPNFGLGDAKVAETIRVEWPSGTVQEFHNVPAKQILTITEPPKLVAEGFSRIGDRVGFQFHLIGAVGRRYRVEISSNLRDWQTWATIASKKRSTYLNQASSFSSWNFFRVIQE